MDKPGQSVDTWEMHQIEREIIEQTIRTSILRQFLQQKIDDIQNLQEEIISLKLENVLLFF